jgi:hypothetical protein
MTSNRPTRREWFGVAGAALAACMAAPARAEAPMKVVVHRSATCGCCKVWAERLRAARFSVEVIDEADMKPVKARLGVPAALASCHTAEVGGYVLEGHVPVSAIERLLIEKPKALGLAVPGMPMGSPGMDMGAEKEVYEVFLFDAGGQSSYGKFEGARAL